MDVLVRPATSRPNGPVSAFATQKEHSLRTAGSLRVAEKALRGMTDTGAELGDAVPTIDAIGGGPLASHRRRKLPSRDAEPQTTPLTGLPAT